MSDLETPHDCRRLVAGFYTLVQDDELLGPVFASRIEDWTDHLDTMSRFWSSIVFGLPLYHGNPLAMHRGLPIEPHHFARWLALWRRATEQLFAGPRADEIIARAGRIAVVLERRLRGAA